MNIKNYLFNFIKNLKKSKKKYICTYLNKELQRFTYLSCAISKKNIEILTADDEFGGYYDKKLILPKKINISNNKIINDMIYIYKIIFSLTSLNLNFYLPENKKNLDYILLASLITVKTIHINIYKEFKNIMNILKLIYPNTNKTNIKKLTGRSLLLETIIKKLTYKKIKIKLNKKEKIWLYKIENINYITQYSFKEVLKKIYANLCDIHKKYDNITLNQLWGYLYYKDKKKYISHFKDQINTKIKNIDKTTKKNKNILIKNSNLNSNNDKKNNLNSLFDYQKTIDKYQGNNSKYNDNTKSDNIDILKNTEINNTTKSHSKSSSIFSSTIINNISINKLEKTTIKVKKFIYNEWDYKIKKYKQNWCNVFEKENNKKIITNDKKNILQKIIKKYKKDIILFKELFYLIMNKKSWIKKQTHGQDIDLDTVIDNYKYIEQNKFNKIYKYKKNNNKDIAISIIFDSSLSTDGYINNKKIIDILKKLTLILSYGINNLIKHFSVSTFYSNTRHDCKHIIIKNFTDNWQTVKYNISHIKPNGYTRIGPAIRHSCYNINKIKTKSKIIILLSDGKPSDYDEYEGNYGINDIKHSITEANKKNIHVKSIIIDNTPKIYFLNMFGKNNYQLISNKYNLHIQLLKIFNNIIN